MEETCIDLCFETNDMCFGCSHVKRMAKKEKLEVERNAILKKSRAKRNVCVQPWHKIYKKASDKNSSIRDKLIKNMQI